MRRLQFARLVFSHPVSSFPRPAMSGFALCLAFSS
jgi:hypothetical protein